MKAGHGRRKGFGFEITIARKFSLWVLGEDGKKPSVDIFWRSTGSGGKAAVERKKGRQTKSDGDIMAIDRRGEFFTDFFFVECKSYKKFDIFSSIMEKKMEPFIWWRKCIEQADLANKEPLMIIKMNGKKSVVLFEGALISDIAIINGMPEAHWCRFCIFESNGISFDNIYMCYFEDFINWVTPHSIQKINTKTKYV